MSTDKTKSRDMTIARRLIAVAVTDFFCWFPVGMCGLLALLGVTISGETNVTLAIFVLPLNSALNPFLYTLNLMLERRRRRMEEKMVKRLRSLHAAVVV